MPGPLRPSGRDSARATRRAQFGCIYDSAQARCMDPPNCATNTRSTCAAVLDLYSEGVLDDETFKGAANGPMRMGTRTVGTRATAATTMAAIDTRVCRSPMLLR